MDENEPAEQFEATDYDEDGNIKLPPPPLAAAKQKRPTVAGLKKELNELKADIEYDVLDWLGNLDMRLEGLEATTATHNKTLLGDVKTRLDILDQGSLSDRADVAEDIAARLDNRDAAIGALAGALRSHLEEPAATPQPAAAEIEFAQPPQQPAGEQIHGSDVEAVAQVAQSLTDILMICRALKAAPDVSDSERSRILHVACGRAGETLTPGLQIRAGVRNVEA